MIVVILFIIKFLFKDVSPVNEEYIKMIGLKLPHYFLLLRYECNAYSLLAANLSYNSKFPSVHSYIRLYIKILAAIHDRRLIFLCVKIPFTYDHPKYS